MSLVKTYLIEICYLGFLKNNAAPPKTEANPPAIKPFLTSSPVCGNCLDESFDPVVDPLAADPLDPAVVDPVAGLFTEVVVPGLLLLAPGLPGSTLENNNLAITFSTSEAVCTSSIAATILAYKA